MFSRFKQTSGPFLRSLLMALSSPGEMLTMVLTAVLCGNQLKNVQQIQATLRAFAAILVDGSVVTWGDVDSGGDSIAVRDQLGNVQRIQSTEGAFCCDP